jgi:hypothetical protein
MKKILYRVYDFLEAFFEKHQGTGALLTIAAFILFLWLSTFFVDWFWGPIEVRRDRYEKVDSYYDPGY